jgi:hypothetical protein
MGDGYAFVYTSQGHDMHVDLDALPWSRKKAWWFNPREGKASPIPEIPGDVEHRFDPPGEAGNDNDWVLVIENADKKWAAPGLVPVKADRP